MSKRGDAGEEGALSRWSRLKTAEKDRRQADSEAAIGAVPAMTEAEGSPIIASRHPTEDAPDPARPAAAQIDPADLPDVESLDESSDFRMFLRDGVPPELRRLALRKLWRVNPVFRELDGLNDYDGDYSAMGIVAEKVATLFNTKTGRISRAEPAPETDDAEDLAADEAIESEAESAAEETARLDDDSAIEPDPDDEDLGDGEGEDEPV